MTGRSATALTAAGAALACVLTGCAAPASVNAPPEQSPGVSSPATSPKPAPASSSAATQAPPSETIQSYVATASRQRVFFGHQSVGFNVMKGINQLFRANGAGTPEYIDLDKKEPVPDRTSRGFVAHNKIGTNGQAFSKIAEFDSLIRNGFADQLDVALFKLCYVDIDARTNVGSIFRKYRTVLRELERDFPELAFVHVTVPLQTDAAAANVTRTRLNTMLRREYGKSGLLWDIAALESTDPKGRKVGGKGYEALFRGYASDGAHLNEQGGQVAAAGLLRVIAHTAWRDQ